MTKLKRDILKFSTTKQHNKSNQHRKHSVSNNKPTSHVLDVLLRIIRHMSASIKHTLVRTVKKVGHLQSDCFVKKKKEKKSKEAKQCQPL